jgi:hypothetical protein
MKIAKFDSEAEKTAVIAAVQKYIPVWIGGNDIVKPGTWRWAPDDSSITYPSIIEKNNGTEKSGGRNCLQLRKSKRDSKYINQFPANCAESQNFICYK